MRRLWYEYSNHDGAARAHSSHIRLQFQSQLQLRVQRQSPCRRRTVMIPMATSLHTADWQGGQKEGWRRDMTSSRRQALSSGEESRDNQQLPADEDANGEEKRAVDQRMMASAQLSPLVSGSSPTGFEVGYLVLLHLTCGIYSRPHHRRLSAS